LPTVDLPERRCSDEVDDFFEPALVQGLPLLHQVASANQRLLRTGSRQISGHLHSDHSEENADETKQGLVAEAAKGGLALRRLRLAQLNRR